jgi:hypothetical protein
VEQSDPNSKDHVEAAVAEVEILEARDEELGFPGLDIRRVTSGGCLDHLRRPVDCGQSAFAEPLADHRRGDPVATADLEDPVVRTNADLIDDALEPLAHPHESVFAARLDECDFAATMTYQRDLRLTG